MGKQIKILCYVDRDNGRDPEMILPLASFAKLLLNATIDFGFHYDTHKIFRYKPHLIILPNTIGSNEYHFLAKFAFEQGIPVFALDSEGNFRTDNSFYHWGCNSSKKYFQEYVCCWSQRTRDYLIDKEPSDKDKIVCTGNLGVDRYVLNDFLDRDTYFNQKGIKVKYDKVITYAAWAFGKLYSKQGQESLVSYFKGDASKLEIVDNQRIEIRDLLEKAIIQNPNILFVLKVHPTEIRPTETNQIKNEVFELKDYPNVIIEGGDTNIDDLINISDLWLSFESTTAIEAWVSKKPTVLLRTNPSFTSTLEDKGLIESQNVVANDKELQLIIDKLFTNELIENDRILVKRAGVISQSVGFIDGKNHIRAGFLLKKVIENYNFDRIKYKFRFKSLIIFVLIKLGILFYNRKLYQKLPKAKKFLWVFEQYSLVKVKNKFNNNLNKFEDFYMKNNIKEVISTPNTKLEDI